MATVRNSSLPPWKEAAHQQYEAFLQKLTVKARAAEEKHIELCAVESPEGFSEIWKRLAGALGVSAPSAIESAGHHALKYFIPDGKYRQQVFALEDTRKGVIHVYVPDILALAQEKGLLKAQPDGVSYSIAGPTRVLLELDVITAETPDMGACKSMLGWGKRALRIKVGVGTDEKVLRTVEQLCELAAKSWAGAASAPAPDVKK